MSEQYNLPSTITEGLFLLVCSGEAYSAEIVPGRSLLTEIMKVLFVDGTDSSPADWQSCVDDLKNMDNWCCDQDVGLTRFKTDVGETDHIELIRITDAVCFMTQIAALSPP